MEAFEKIQRFYKEHKRMPSYGEIRALFHFKSRNSGVKLAQKLIETEHIRKGRDGKLLPGPQFFDVRVLGEVVAGFPSPAEEELSDTMSLDEYLIRNKAATYMLKVSGDSMKDAGIMAGDMVLVERGTTAGDGQIVIAEVDGQWTMKYLRKKGKTVYLEAANNKYKPIYPTDDLKIAAVVKAVIRKY